ncbi:hypothetical protein Trydic_g13842 [Trypoxylus dichotomus]
MTNYLYRNALGIKKVEESDARKRESNEPIQGAMAANKNKWKYAQQQNTPKGEQKGEFKFRCHRCRQLGHKAVYCKNKKFDKKDNAAGSVKCADNRCHSHICKESREFVQIADSERGQLNLENQESTEIVANGTATFMTKVHGEVKIISLHDALHVPTLRANLLSIGKMMDKGYDGLFRTNGPLIVDKDDVTKLVANRVGELYCMSEYESNGT